MKKTFIISIFALIMVSSCQGKEKMGFTARDALNLQIADKIVAFINDKDIDGLYNLFSEEVKENDSKLNSDVKLLIDYLDGYVDSYEKWAVSSTTSIEYSQNSTYYYSKFKMKVNNIDYFLYYIYYPKNDFDVNKEGIRTIRVFKVDDYDKYFCYWQDLKEGIIIQELGIQ